MRRVRARSLALILVVFLLSFCLSSISRTSFDAKNSVHQCRMWGMAADSMPHDTVLDQLVSFPNSLQALAASNPNGWGLAYYSTAEPIVMRGQPSADDDPDFIVAAGQVADSGGTVAVGHIRKASSGLTNIPDPHPFERFKNNRSWLFCHNGGIDKSVLIDLIGTQYLAQNPPSVGNNQNEWIDSELYFIYVLKCYEENGWNVKQAIATATSNICNQVPGTGETLNFLLTDGETLWGFRKGYTLYYYCDSQYCALASQYPTSTQGGWIALSDYDLITLRRGEVPVISRLRDDFNLHLNVGWNMVSFPVMPFNTSFSSIFAGISFYQVLAWSGTSYTTPTAVEVGRGYWVLVLSATILNITGTPLESYELNLPAGWTMIGSIYNCTVDATRVFPSYYQLVTWDSTHYADSAIIEPGEGYWALVLTPTHIAIDESLDVPVEGIVTLTNLTSPSGAFRWLDVADQAYGVEYRGSYNYSEAVVTVTYSLAGSRLTGLLVARNLKPDFAYQLKLVGTPGSLDNERIGLAGRWWQEEWSGSAWTGGSNLNNKGDGSSPNPNDLTYFSRYLIENTTSPTGYRYRYTGYLVFGYFITDSNGDATLASETGSCYHVLWKTGQRLRTADDGPLNTVTFDPDPSQFAYDQDYSSSTVSIFGEWERLPMGEVNLTPGQYDCHILLTEESFHGTAPLAGNWAAAMGAQITFTITP